MFICILNCTVMKNKFVCGYMAMNSFFINALLFLALVVYVDGSELSPNVLLADLDGDGTDERITCVKFAETEDAGEFYQVRVIKGDGSVLWESPKSLDMENPFVFGNWHFGSSLPQLAADIDGDGAIELVTPAPQSDVSPAFFKVLHWKSGRFVMARSGILLESPSSPGSGLFKWSDSEASEGTWISAFLGVKKNGNLQVEIFEYRGNADVKIATVTVAPVKDGFQTQGAIQMVKTPATTPGSVTAPVPMPVSSPNIYRARLSRADHYNSSGTRLDGVGDILRQDRANFHRGNGDAEDGTDSIFASLQARNGMSKKTPVLVGGKNPGWENAIINGTPLVEIEATGNQLKIKYISP